MVNQAIRIHSVCHARLFNGLVTGQHAADAMNLLTHLNSRDVLSELQQLQYLHIFCGFHQVILQVKVINTD